MLKALPDITGVIVADDDALIRSVLRAKLEALGQDVHLAADGMAAVELAIRVRASLIILDIQMPQLNGLLACERIRKMPGHKDTPIVFLTGRRDHDAEVAAERVGATTFLVKPFQTAPLLEVLSRFLPIDEAALLTIRREAARVNRISQAKPRSAEDGRRPFMDHIS